MIKIHKNQNFQRHMNADIWQNDKSDMIEKKFEADKLKKLESLQPAQLYLSNLHQNVSELDLLDVFSSIGKLRDVFLHYDKSGHSLGNSLDSCSIHSFNLLLNLGTANVFFELKVDAVKAIKEFHGRLLDGKPLRIELLNNSMEQGLYIFDMMFFYLKRLN